MNTMPVPFRKMLYSAFFLLVLPLLLVFWAEKTETFVTCPPVESREGGIFLMVLGGGMMFWAMGLLILKGKGLPLNAFPPKKLVKTGPYRLLRHPIYWGFAMMLAGYFIYAGSASGLWLVTPLTLLGMIALVLGYEGIELKERFPDEDLTPLLEWQAGKEKPVLRKKVAGLLVILLLLGVTNFLAFRGLGSDHTDSMGDLSLWSPWWNFICLLLVLITPDILRARTNLRQWIRWGASSLLLGLFCMLICEPFLGVPLYYPTSGLLTVPIYLLFISLYSAFLNTRRPILYASLAVIPFLILLAQYLPDFFLYLLFGALITGTVLNAERLWEFTRSLSEKLANSWREWVFGPVRVINHGFYVGAGAFLGILFTGMLAGEGYSWGLLAFAVTVVVFSALWAQIIEGSEKLKRPFGFYGALVGIFFASLLVWWLGYDPWVLIGVISVCMPWVQGIGRMRCLINGCCHGKRTDNPHLGIRYNHPRSRVGNISGMSGELLHPTPLYSMVWLFPVGFVLLALWEGGAAPNFIFGLYLILNGIGRFVEEAYRGEVQTPLIRGLRLYQWTAVLSVLVGIVFTLFRVEAPVMEPNFGWKIVLAALLGGAFLVFAMGVDFPNSNRRFSRLV